MAAIAASHAVSHVQNIIQRLQLGDKRLLLAVSGGADSMALAYIASRAVGPRNCIAVTVDHGFRPESAHEAAAVGRYMQKLGIQHEIRRLKWEEVQKPPVQRLEEVARQRRYTEIGNVCQMYQVSAVLTGHHSGDQAETFLFRFIRHSGIHGLSGMSLQTALPFALPAADNKTPVIVRLLLDFDKRTLYSICKAGGIEWFEDASNSDPRFKRNMLRQIIREADDDDRSPFNVSSLLKVRKAMQGHREVIDRGLASLLDKHATVRADLGVVELAAETDGQQLPRWASNPAVRERALASVVGWVNCKDHPPELAHLRQFEQLIVSFYKARKAGASIAQTPVSTAGVTMLPPTVRHGWLFCRQRPRANEIQITKDLALGATALWDGRLLICVQAKPGRSIPEAVTWRVYSQDAAMHKWADQLLEHRRVCRKTHRPADMHQAVLAVQPIISVKPVPDAQPTLAFAFGSVCAETLAATDLDISVRAVRGTDLVARN
ncbi:hypothetical protein IWW49_002166 [Coemansia sp. RSA 1797]|nr:hypothetical protein IWW49_002166 [Coemansia sp. RSA 1797]